MAVYTIPTDAPESDGTLAGTLNNAASVSGSTDFDGGGTASDTVGIGTMRRNSNYLPFLGYVHELVITTSAKFDLHNSDMQTYLNNKWDVY